MNQEPRHEALRRQMADIRAVLDDEVDEFADDARGLVDWQQYVAAYPLASLAAATALGYLVVPRRLEVVSPDAETLEKLARKNRLVVEHHPRGEERPGFLASALSMVGNVLLRATIAYVGRQAGRILEGQASEAPPQQVAAS